jgi:hypothetical protein
MLKLEITKSEGFVVRADESMRLDVQLVRGRMVMFAYRGYEDDSDQEPDLVYDGTIGHENNVGALNVNGLLINPETGEAFGKVGI